MKSKARKTPRTIFQEVKTSALCKAPWNYKDNDDRAMAALGENIKRNGMLENLVVRQLKTGALEIINGNHRYDALQQLGIEEVTVCNVGKVSDAVARRIAVELNETEFPTDKLRLGQVLREITAEFDVEDLMATMPYSDKELDKLMNLEDGPTSRGVQKSPSDASEDTVVIKICLDQEQFEAWLIWKQEAGTENDTLALCRAVADAILHRKESDPPVKDPAGDCP